MTETSII